MDDDIDDDIDDNSDDDSDTGAVFCGLHLYL